ncbi:MAG: MFS transporter [Clostridia bacterium]|nr:MFS transporter [Clostridia bacterium]
MCRYGNADYRDHRRAFRQDRQAQGLHGGRLYRLGTFHYVLCAHQQRASGVALSDIVGGVTRRVANDRHRLRYDLFGSSANDAAFNAWLTDETSGGNRGAAEGVNAVMPLIAMLAVFGGFMAFDLDRGSSWTAIFLIIGIAVLIIGILGLFLIKESAVRRKENSNYFANIIYGFRPSVIKQNKWLYLTLIGFALFGISIQVFMPYLIIYYEVSLGMENYVMIMAPAIVIAAVASVLYGRLYDRFGYKKVIFPAVLTLICGYVIMFFVKTTAPVFIGSLLVMVGYLCGNAVFGAMLRDKTPEGKAGMFQGLRIVCQVLIPGVIGPAIGAKVLENAKEIVNNDGTTSFLPDERIFMASLIVSAVLLAYLVFTTVKKDSKNG